MNEEVSRSIDFMVIPMFIWDNPNLTAVDRTIYAEINSLDNHSNGGDYCYASNQYLADFCHCSERKVRDAIHKLVDMGYLRVVKTDGRKRWIESLLKGHLEKFATQSGKICHPDRQEMPQSLLEENIVDKNSFNNNKNTILTDSASDWKSDEPDDKSFKWHTEEQYSDYVKYTLSDTIKSVVSKYEPANRRNELFDYAYSIFVTYFNCYTKKYHTYHPWLNRDNVNRIITQLIEYDEFHFYKDLMLIRVNQWFRMSHSGNDGNINVFATKGILKKIDRRLKQNGKADF